jgi:NAD(P)-dependent dehydrogenase (short-subunit alcohol dehydrogenase family)
MLGARWRSEERRMTKVVMVTGGSRGIGAATARLAAQAGYAVCLSYVENAAAAERVVADVANAGGRALARRADVGVEADVVALFRACDEAFGPLSALVNNAGIVARQGRLEDFDAARLERVLRANVVGSMLCAREAVRRMSRRRGGAGGAIVNVSSKASVLGSPGEFVDYAASKGAIDTFTIGLAKEVAADGIRVNAVRPGLIDTDIHAASGEPGRVARLKDSVPMRREGSAEEVARAILWLLSEDSSYTTGSFLDVAGGR